MRNINILSRKLIKPCSTTPEELGKFQISFTDEMSPTMNVPVILYYYCFNHDHTNNFKQSLENSLAQVLPQFYPLAGRYIKEIRLIDCSDQGVEYLEAKVESTRLAELLAGPAGMEPEQLNGLLPRAYGAADEFTDPLLSIQVSEFECGGIAIGFSISHRIADASTMSTFLNAWADIACLGDREGGRNNINISPTFDSPLLFPGRNLPKLEVGIPRGIDEIEGHPKSVTMRFVFDSKTISTIRAKMVTQVSRVQLVSGLILRALLALDQAKHIGNSSRTSLLLQTVNFRDKTVPPLPKHSCGNLCLLSVAKLCTPDQESSSTYDQLQGVIDLLGNSIRKTISDCGSILNSGEDGHMIVIKPFNEIAEIFNNTAADQLNSILLNSWCRFPFYDADFGWGKPAWVSLAKLPVSNTVVLMDTKDGHGIEAWVAFDEADLPIFPLDQDIKSFTASSS